MKLGLNLVEVNNQILAFQFLRYVFANRNTYIGNFLDNQFSLKIFLCNLLLGWLLNKNVIGTPYLA